MLVWHPRPGRRSSRVGGTCVVLRVGSPLGHPRSVPMAQLQGLGVRTAVVLTLCSVLILGI